MPMGCVPKKFWIKPYITYNNNNNNKFSVTEASSVFRVLKTLEAHKCNLKTKVIYNGYTAI